MTTTMMIDAIGATAGQIPANTPKVAGYVTGTGPVPWTAADWARFPHAGKVRIDQSPAGAMYSAGHADVYDIEALAGTPHAFPAMVKTRIAAGHEYSDFYANRSTVPTVVADLNAAGTTGWYDGHVRLWLADWNLSLAVAEHLIGSQLHGLKIVAVQWASPSSNPATLLPGSVLNLKQANCDLSITAGYWHAPPAPPPPPPAELYGYLVTQGAVGGVHALTGRAVTSTDSGKTWA